MPSLTPQRDRAVPHTRRSILRLARDLGAGLVCSPLLPGTSNAHEVSVGKRDVKSLNIRPASAEYWDSAAVNYQRGDVLVTEVLPAFSPGRPEMHFRSLMLSEAVPVGANGFRAGVEMAVECFGTQHNPFGLDSGDPRLAAGALVLLDFDTGIILDFFASNSQIWVLYERENFAALRDEQQHAGWASPVSEPYPAYTTFRPTKLTTVPGQWHAYEIVYDKPNDRIEYWCDGEKVFAIEKVGAPVNQPKPVVKLDRVAVGGGIFVVLDDLRDDRVVPDDNPRIPGLLAEGQSGNFGQGARVKYRNFYIR